MTTKLTTEVEAAIINLVQARPCLYDKGNANYKNTRRKETMWSEIVTQLELQGITITGKCHN